MSFLCTKSRILKCSFSPRKRSPELNTIIQKIYFSSRTSNANYDPYSILKVPRNSDIKDIKKAYIKRAKETHPDLNPGDKSAKDRFQEVTRAYEILSHPEKRKMYDQYGSNSRSNDGTYNNQNPESPEESFRKMWSELSDVDVIIETVRSYSEDLMTDISEAVKEADKGNFTPAYEVIRDNRGLILGIIVPVALVLRFPLLVTGAFRVLFGLSQLIIVAVIRSGHGPVLLNWLWSILTRTAARRNKRGAGRQK